MNRPVAQPGLAPTEEHVIPVVYGVDDRFARPLAASIASALEYLDSKWRLQIYVIDGGLGSRNRLRLTSSFKDKPCKITWLRPGDFDLGDLKVGGGITVASYFRLLIPDLLPEGYSKVIYLDADLIVQADLTQLWTLPINNHHLLAVQDQGVRLVSGPYGLTNYRELGIPDDAKYFNAGVLVFNLPKWRQAKTAGRILEYVRSHHQHIRFHDQDGLNAMLWNDWGELDPRWNQMPQILQVRSPANSPFDALTFKRVVESPYVIHYASADKPWRFGCRHPAATKFFAYLDRTAYAGFRPTRWYTRFSDLRDFVRNRLTKLRARTRALRS